jgi:large subunit ribosomal protein L33
MAKKAKAARDNIVMETVLGPGEEKLKHRFTTEKNKKNTTERLELKRYNPRAQKHMLYREVK